MQLSKYPTALSSTHSYITYITPVDVVSREIFCYAHCVEPCSESMYNLTLRTTSSVAMKQSCETYDLRRRSTLYPQYIKLNFARISLDNIVHVNIYHIENRAIPSFRTSPSETASETLGEIHDAISPPMCVSPMCVRPCEHWNAMRIEQQHP